MRTVGEAMFWIDQWTYSAKSLDLRDRSDAPKFKYLFTAGARCHLLVTNAALTVWANLLLKCRDAFLGKLKDDMSFEAFLDSCNTPQLDLLSCFCRRH